MPESPDDVAIAVIPTDDWAQPGVRFATDETRWALIGGATGSAAGVELHLQIAHPDDPNLIRRLVVRLPVTVDGDTVAVGSPEVMWA